MSNQIDVNQLSNALQQKIDLPSGKSQADIDYVVEWQAPDSSNDYKWYRKYKSGWVEQGGKKSVADATNTQVTFIITMADTNYFFTSGQMTFSQSNDQYVNGWALTTYSATGFTIHSATNGTNTFSWRVEGFAATE